MQNKQQDAPRIVGRYMLFDEIASGGMATVRLGRLLGEVGFSRTVAIKCLHPQFAKEQEFANMFIDEARLAARVRHPNVVPILDVVSRQGELFLVMEYVQGEPLSKLLRLARKRRTRVPLRVAASIMTSLLDGLHAAHEAKSEKGEPLSIVHRDVSPQNVMIGRDGVARVLDFGVAKAAGRLQTTQSGQLKGKIPYMAPEQLRAEPVDRRTDVYSASVVMWEVLVGRRLFNAPDEIGTFGLILKGEIAPPSTLVPGIPSGFDEAVLKGLALSPADRFQSAREMALVIERLVGVASQREVGEWVEQYAGDNLKKRANRIAEIESISSVSMSNTQVVSPQSVGEQAFASGMTPPSSGNAPAPPPAPPTPIFQMASPPADFGAGGVTTSSGLARPPSTPSDGTNIPMEDIEMDDDFFVANEKRKKKAQNIALAAIAFVVLSAFVIVIVILFNQFSDGKSAAQSPPPAEPVLSATPRDAEADVPADGSRSDVPDAGLPDARPDAVADAKPTSTAGEASKVRHSPPRHVVAPKQHGRTPAKTTSPTKPAPTSHPKPSGCNPPYVIDANGVRVPKPQCL